MRNRRLSFSFGACIRLVFVMLVVVVKPADAITTACVQGCVNQLAGDMEECKWWLMKEHASEATYAYCLEAAVNHAEVCLGGCNTASGGSKYKVGTPGGPYQWYGPNDIVTLSAGLQDDSVYIHGVGPTLSVAAYLLDLYGVFSDSTPFQNRNWVPVGSATFDGDSLWQATVDMGSFQSPHGYLARYDFTLQSDTTYIWVSSLMSRSVVTDVPVSSNAAPARLSFGPNPARDRTLISFNVPKAGPASVAIYDLLGRRLRGWSWANVSAGAHQVTWNWVSDAGRPAPSTIVFCRLTVNGTSVARRMIRVK